MKLDRGIYGLLLGLVVGIPVGILIAALITDHYEKKHHDRVVPGIAVPARPSP